MIRTHRDISQKVKDHSGTPKNRLPPVPQPDLILFHWSPIANRNAINHYGLRPNRPSLDGLWNPPYVCFSADPLMAWYLSGNMWPERSPGWDLWAVNTDEQTSFDHMELITDTYPDTGRRYVKEYRIYKRVYKRDVKYIGTRYDSSHYLKEE